MKRSAQRLVVVDVGNTSTAVGLWSRGRVTRVGHFDGDVRAARARAEELARLGACGVGYLSVVPGADAGWRAFARRALRLPFVRISSELFPTDGLSLDYPRPETIGADRLADAAAAVDRYGAPVVVCDFGTAFTAAAVTADRVWRGGVIAPGFPLMRDYLFERTAKLPRMELGGKCPKIGRSTEEAMRFGAIVGYRGMVREITAELARNFRTDFKLVATGGFAKWVLRGSGMPFTVDSTLTLHGAGLLASRALSQGEGR
ncbi:MAG: type III pantothenate kinase [Kiritimatiellae bacterium]|nr:type III pantothenate kinase [Kiritimatiellia bacterium]